MRASRLLLPTIKEDPAGAEAASHKLMVRAGLVRQLAAGVYVFLPAGWRVMQRIAAIIRDEMDAIGCQEILMPVINPAEIWQQSGRWSEIGEELFRFKDRKGSDMALAMTHEEVVTWLAAREVQSYKQLPQLWYHIQTKERDEARPRSGVLRTREFIMKDSYSLDRDVEGLRASYDKHIAAYDAVCARCGLSTMMVQADPGMMGGAIAHEYMAFSEAGEDEIVYCDGCGYAANVELAVSGLTATPVAAGEAPGVPHEVHTPGARTIDQVSRLLGVEPSGLVKSLVVMADERGPVMALVRGDHELNEAKLRRVVGEFRMATADEVAELQGAEAGFVGPVGTTIPILADEVLHEGVYAGGANKNDYHLADITAAQFTAEFHDLRAVLAGDRCRDCGKPLVSARAIEIGHIFQLGTKYSKTMGATYLDEQGVEREIVMGSYGIGLARIAAAAIEQHHDDDGIIWPASIAPFDVQLLLVRPSDEIQTALAERVYGELQSSGIEVLFDDRELSPGVKFKDADLIGCPLQVIVGKKAPDGVVELKLRESGRRFEAAVGGLIGAVRDSLDGLRAALEPTDEAPRAG